MYEAVFKYNKSSPSLKSKLLPLFVSWLALEKLVFDLIVKQDVETYQMEVMEIK